MDSDLSRGFKPKWTEIVLFKPHNPNPQSPKVFFKVFSVVETRGSY